MSLFQRLLLCAAIGSALPACHPSHGCVSGGTDVPDGELSDTDCDGIDGAIDRAVFVSSATGSDSNDGSMPAPVATIAHAIEVARTTGKSNVLVANGYYSESIVLVPGIGIHGGYDATNGWTRDLDTLATVVSAPESPVIRGTSIDVPTTVSGLSVVGPAAGPSGSSMAVWLVDASSVSLENCELRGGRGGDGADGSSPTAIPHAGHAGNDGLPPVCAGSTCGFTTTTVAAAPSAEASCTCGAGGQSSASSLVASGHAGGGGQSMDAAGCRTETRIGYSSSGGEALTSAGAGNHGRDGADGARGGAGAGGIWTTAFFETGYFPSSGQPGQTGLTGGGGGAGGSARSFICQNGVDVLIGGTGGSGGSGGCGGAGGGGGSSGGASIALYLWRSTPTLRHVALIPGEGGSGGDGVPGVDGALGGDGSHGVGSSTVVCPGSGTIGPWGGDGGKGGRGGAGGVGGGGAGGVALGVLLGESSGIASSSHDITAPLDQGSAGLAGTGGSSGRQGILCGAYHIGDADCLPLF